MDNHLGQLRMELSREIAGVRAEVSEGNASHARAVQSFNARLIELEKKAGALIAAHAATHEDRITALETTLRDLQGALAEIPTALDVSARKGELAHALELP